VSQRPAALALRAGGIAAAVTNFLVLTGRGVA